MHCWTIFLKSVYVFQKKNRLPENFRPSFPTMLYFRCRQSLKKLQ